MSREEEEEETVTLGTVNSVTLTQDSDGSIILHCPSNGGSHTQSHTAQNPNTICSQQYNWKVYHSQLFPVTLCVCGSCAHRWRLRAYPKETTANQWRPRWHRLTPAVLRGHAPKLVSLSPHHGFRTRLNAEHTYTTKTQLIPHTSHSAPSVVTADMWCRTQCPKTTTALRSRWLPRLTMTSQKKAWPKFRYLFSDLTSPLPGAGLYWSWLSGLDKSILVYIGLCWSGMIWTDLYGSVMD